MHKDSFAYGLLRAFMPSFSDNIFGRVYFILLGLEILDFKSQLRTEIIIG